MLTETQIEMRGKISAAVAAVGSIEIVYVSEWPGELPFGVYHWIECRNKSISNDFPAAWTRADLVALERYGLLKLLSDWQDPSDEFHFKATYQVTAPPSAA